METFSNSQDVLSDQAILRLHLFIDRIGSMPFRNREARLEDSIDLTTNLIKSLRFAILGCGFRRNGTDCLRRLIDLESCVEQRLIAKYAHKQNSVVCVVKALLDSHEESEDLTLPEPHFSNNTINVLAPEQILFAKAKLVDYLGWLRKSSLVKHNDGECSSDYESLINRILTLATIAHISQSSHIFLDFIEMTNLELCFDTKNPERSLANWGVFRGLFLAHTKWCAPFLLINNSNNTQFNDLIEQLFVQAQS
jgi:hypothetical protein